MSVVMYGSIYALKLLFLLIKEGGRLGCVAIAPVPEQRNVRAQPHARDEWKKKTR